MQFLGLNPSRLGFNPELPYASKSDRQRLHSQRLQTVAQLRPITAAIYPRASNASEATYAREYLVASIERRERERAQAQLSGLAYEHNPAKIKAKHECEQRRLAELEREIKAENRLLSWTTRKD